MANWVVLVASCCLLLASPVFGSGSSLCTYPLSEIKTLVFIDSKNTSYYFSPCGSIGLDQCGTATLCVTTSSSVFSPFSDAFLAHSSDGLYKISYNSSGLEVNVLFLDGKFTSYRLNGVPGEPIVPLTMEIADREKPGTVGDASKNIPSASPGNTNSSFAVNLAVATAMMDGAIRQSMISHHAGLSAQDAIMPSHSRSFSMILSTILHSHSRSVVFSHGTALPFSSKIFVHTVSMATAAVSSQVVSDRGFGTSSHLTTSPGFSTSITGHHSSPPPITGLHSSSPTTGLHSSPPPITGLHSSSPPATGTPRSSPHPVSTSHNSPPATGTPNSPPPNSSPHISLPATTSHSSPSVIANHTAFPPTRTSPVLPPPANATNDSLPTSTPPVFPSTNGSSLPQSVSLSSSSSQASSPESSPSTGLGCTTKIVIAVSVTFVATAVLVVIATLAVLIFCKRRAKKGSSYVQLAPTVYFDDDDDDE